MSIEHIKDIADSVLFEGYILYPYRPSAIKNKQRWTFGGVFPCAFDGDEPSVMRTETLLNAERKAEVDVIIRFLHTQRRRVVKSSGESVEVLESKGAQYVAWDEALVREVSVPNVSISSLVNASRRVSVFIPAEHGVELIPEGAGEIVRHAEALTGLVELSAEPVHGNIVRLRIAIENTTPIQGKMSRGEAQHRAFLSTHTILIVRDAEFISLIDPPSGLKRAAADCDNQGTWPVLAGEEPAKDMVLSAPIILYDYPKVAPESKGSFFDGTEIDEMLTLRVMTLTDEEQREMAATDPRTREILERCRTFSRDQLYDLHGAFRLPRSRADALAVGTHVRLHPKRDGDIFDTALKDKIAVVQAIERDLDDRVHIAVTLLDDPGQDLGVQGFPGHRFFFAPDEVEAVAAGVKP